MRVPPKGTYYPSSPTRNNDDFRTIDQCWVFDAHCAFALPHSGRCPLPNRQWLWYYHFLHNPIHHSKRLNTSVAAIWCPIDLTKRWHVVDGRTPMCHFSLTMNNKPHSANCRLQFGTQLIKTRHAIHSRMNSAKHLPLRNPNFSGTFFKSSMHPIDLISITIFDISINWML